MAADLQTALSYAENQIDLGNITTEQANVLVIQIMGVRVINSKISAEVRKSLNAAVKRGEIGRIAKQGLRPEVFHHKNARANALELRERIEREKLESIAKILK